MSTPDSTVERPQVPEGFDTGSHREFFEYYKSRSESPQTMQRFADIADVVLRVARDAIGAGPLDVLDIGCGAGTQSRFWTSQGHRYHGLDINAPLVELARERAAALGDHARFDVASATQLPFADASFDVCVLPELLEHIEYWQACLDEAVRVLRPGGVLYLSTSNWLCPVQYEFGLPGYSWYPPVLKRYIVARTQRDWGRFVSYVKYPAVHWFSFYELRRYLAPRGFTSLDRFDVMRLERKPAPVRWLVAAVRRLPPLRLLAQMATPYTVVVAYRARKAG
jgi:2-polyprenyl-6-hydroxyphenyl methylase/3-demethylubiquinone-9 3-methyltransferase